MSLRPVLAAWAFAALVALAATADDEPLVTDRPDFTESAATVTRGRTQVEMGYTFTSAGDFDEHAMGELLVRIGWTEIVGREEGCRASRISH
jgi:hypothetical protein